MEKRLFLIDGNSLINRAFYALPPLSSTAGVPTNAVYGLTMMLFRLQEDYAPDHILVTFDVSGPTFRHEEYALYKANRKGMPDDLRVQMPVIKELLDLLGIPRLELAGFEADDLIGTVARLGEQQGFNVYIVTGDRDAFQLISPQTQVLFTKKGITETEEVDQAALQKAYGLKPEQIVDLKGLMGDSSDNIPGVPGVGEKTALKLLADYQTMEGVYTHIDQLKGKLKQRLQEFEEQARLSRELATIRRDVPIEVDFTGPVEADQGAVRELFGQLGFKSLLERLPSDAPLEAVPWKQDYLSVTEKTWPRFRDALKKASKAYLGEFVPEGTLLCLVGEDVFSVDRELAAANLVELGDLLAEKELFCTSSKQLQHYLGRTGNPLPIAFDLELALYCLNPEQRWDFSTLAAHFGLPTQAPPVAEPAFEVVRLRLLEQVAPALQKQLREEQLWPLFGQIELPLAAVLARMEATGILVDPGHLQEMSADLAKSLQELSEAIYKEAGLEFNINSPKQLGSVLFERLGLPVLKRTKTGPSTSADVLEELSYHPIVSSVLEYRQVAKLKSTYADALGELISPVTKRIHTTFNQTVTATGRLSSTHPNLQNIPVRTEEGRRIRQAFVAPPDHYLLGADYSQIELRLLAHISGDDALIEAFLENQDIHARTAAEVFGLPIEEVTGEQRNAAKAINFGIVYGISSFGLARGINLTREQAQAYIDTYFLRYPKVKAFLDGQVELGREHGFVQTIYKRRRYLPELKSRNYAARSFAARTAMNSPIQGSAADIIKLAMLRVQAALEQAQLKSRLLLQVHDELVLEVPREELGEAVKLVKREMETVMELAVPLVVGVFYGANWRDVERYA